ncbi:phosphotransferase family protein [Phreatobacter stygius]|uniref:Phosphotransferase family protein n=1 Tax=Phreatobacter stygius TaxID=1940610 RepID=A0A4D7AUL2_9HYPH|nr:phosphotransferase family protein [Phreatobacter stygius]QCI63315.1 phosphotransferase family protein [Phreatobacter stygius]
MTDDKTVEFDTARLDAYLRQALGLSGGRPEIARISGGQSNPTFFVSYDTRRLVLRKQPPGELLPSAHAIDREYRVISALAGTDVPVPPALLYCDDRNLIGTPFYVMERLDGRVFHDCALDGVAPDQRRAMYRSMAETLAALHNIDPAARGLGDFGRPGDYFARQIGRWTKQLQAARTRDDANFDRLIAWLPAHIPRDDLSAIAHGDYRIGNLMFHQTEPRVIAILDWELSTLGHPLGDLSHSCMAWHSAPDEYGGLVGLDLAALGIPSRAAYEADYYAMADHPARLTPFHMAYAMFRWAAIFEGIAVRAKAGTAAADNAEAVGRLAAVFARRAAELT